MRDFWRGGFMGLLGAFAGVVIGLIGSLLVTHISLDPKLELSAYMNGYDDGYRMSYVCEGLTPMNIGIYNLVRDTVKLWHNKNHDEMFVKCQRVWGMAIAMSYKAQQKPVVVDTTQKPMQSQKGKHQ